MEYCWSTCGTFLELLLTISVAAVDYFCSICGIFLWLLWNISLAAMEYFHGSYTAPGLALRTA